MRTIAAALLMLVAAGGAQYRCDWGVVATSGGDMTVSVPRHGSDAMRSEAGARPARGRGARGLKDR